MTTVYQESAMSAPRKPSTSIHVVREFEIDGCPYSVKVVSTPGMTDFVTLELVGMGPDGEATDGRFTVHTSALPHLNKVLSDTFTGLAALFGAAGGPLRGDRPGRPRRRPGRSHQPWTADLDNLLAAAWRSADTALPPEQLASTLAQALEVPVADVRRQFEQATAVSQPENVIAAIAALMERTPVAISSRLERLKLDPRKPGVQTGPVPPSGPPRGV